jgi:AcrR family transcriptional regulator
MAPRRARILVGQSDDRALRDHLIQVTERLLAERGLEELTTRRIAREAGVADGVLYNHFENKDALMLEALVARMSTLMRAFRDACPRPGTDTVEANLERLATAMLELQRAVLPLFLGLVGRRPLLERFLAAVHSAAIGGPDAVLHCVHDYLAAEQRLGRLSEGSEAHIVGVLLFAITQLQALVTHFRSTENGSSDATEELVPVVRFLVEALTEVSAGRANHDEEGASG